MNNSTIPAPQVPTAETLANSWSSLVSRFQAESGRSLAMKFSELNNRFRPGADIERKVSDPFSKKNVSPTLELLGSSRGIVRSHYRTW